MKFKFLLCLPCFFSPTMAADLPHFVFTSNWQAVPSLTATTSYRIFNVGDVAVTITSQPIASPPTTQAPDEIGERVKPRSYTDIAFPVGEAIYVRAAEFGAGRVLARPLQ
jgi:hypothetical protein